MKNKLIKNHNLLLIQKQKGNKMNTVKKKRSKSWTIIPLEMINNKNLSWNAKGVLSFLLSFPDKYEISLSEIINFTHNDEKDFSNGVQELEKQGYLKIEKNANSKEKIIIIDQKEGENDNQNQKK